VRFVAVTLGYPLRDRTRANGTVIRAVSEFNATLSALNSLSVWWALTGDPGLAECHDVAARAVVDYLERFGSTSRVRSNGGRLHPDSQGLTVAAFRQTTSCLDDPQLHTHLTRQPIRHPNRQRHTRYPGHHWSRSVRS
jgi:conjugative relaxase-like TrwC/TraI family protein